MNYILIIGVFEALFLILLLLTKKEKERSDFFLGVIIGLYALSIFATYLELYNLQNDFPFPKIININWLFLFLHGPALWFYIKSLSTRNFRFRPVYLLHFVPFATFLIYHYINFISLPAGEKIMIAKNELFKDFVFYKITLISIGISTITYNVWALNLIRKYRQKLKQYFSATDNIDLNWLRILTIASLTVYVVNVAMYNLDQIFHFAPYKILMMAAYGFAVVYVLFIGFFGLKQTNVFLTVPDYDRTRPLTERNIARDESDFITRLREFMKTEKPYLDPELNISKLSEMLKVKPEYLSQVLNEQLGQNFFDFINKYRIEEFKEQCTSDKNKHLSIVGVAFDSGFNSKASFYRAFKKFEHKTPIAYIRSVS